MRVYDIIAKKRDGGELSREEIEAFVGGYAADEIPDYQMSALLMAICIRGMTPREISDLTLCMAHSGETVDLSSIPGIKVDKHSTGGVGDKTTLIAAPIAASLGVKVAKMSGRGLGHTGGTVDKMEAIPGMRTSLTREEFFEIVRKIGISVVGQSGNLVPADKKLYALRDVTATVESIPLIASSIMSKKIAAGSDCILLDVKTGSGAFMKTAEDSVKLAQTMVSIGESVGRRTIALITDMDRPLGRAIGNSLEIAEVCETLQGKGPDDLTKLSLDLAANMLFLAEKGTLAACRKMAWEAVQNGSAFEKLKEMAALQGGDTSVLDDPDRFEKAKVTRELKASRSGYLCGMDTHNFGTASVILRAGREKKGDAIDFSAGILLRKTVGDEVRSGDVIAELYSQAEEKCAAARELLEQSVLYGDNPPPAQPLVYARVTADIVERC